MNTYGVTSPREELEIDEFSYLSPYFKMLNGIIDISDIYDEEHVIFIDEEFYVYEEECREHINSLIKKQEKIGE